MEHGEAVRWAGYIEGLASDLYNFQRRDEWYNDGVGTDGKPWEVKACRRRVGSDGRRGRWWIEREAHERLVEAGGRYALAVYDPRPGHAPIAGFESVRADVLDDLTQGLKWLSTGDHPKGESARLVTWSTMIGPEELPGDT